MLKQISLAFPLALAAGAASAYPGDLLNPAQAGYVTSSGGVVKSGFGLCWHTRDWTPDRAVEQCDPVPRAAASLQPAAAGPKSTPKIVPKLAAAAKAPEPVPAPPPPAPVMKRISLETELLFDFDSAVLRPAGRAKLQQIAFELHGADVKRIEAVGHADRIASHAYNQDLSDQRAQAVKAYLAELGLEPGRIYAEGQGETEPVTAGGCANMGPENRSNLKLVACLQPDRRVELEVRGARAAKQ